MDPDRVQGWLREWSRLWKVPELPERIRITVNRRLRRSLGRCHPTRGRIDLHPRLADGSETLFREVVCHEAAHAAVFLLHGTNVRPHGPEWSRMLEAAGYKPRARMREADLEPALFAATRPRVVYRHHCRTCGAAWSAGRPVRRWRCRACHEAGLGGRLEITSQSAVGVESP